MSRRFVSDVFWMFCEKNPRGFFVYRFTPYRLIRFGNRSVTTPTIGKTFTEVFITAPVDYYHYPTWWNLSYDLVDFSFFVFPQLLRRFDVDVVFAAAVGRRRGQQLRRRWRQAVETPKGQPPVSGQGRSEPERRAAADDRGPGATTVASRHRAGSTQAVQWVSVPENVTGPRVVLWGLLVAR